MLCDEFYTDSTKPILDSAPGMIEALQKREKLVFDTIASYLESERITFLVDILQHVDILPIEQEKFLRGQIIAFSDGSYSLMITNIGHVTEYRDGVMEDLFPKPEDFTAFVEKGGCILSMREDALKELTQEGESCCQLEA